MKKIQIAVIVVIGLFLFGCSGQESYTVPVAESASETATSRHITSKATQQTLPPFDINLVSSDKIKIDYPIFPTYGVDVNKMIKTEALRPLEAYSLIGFHTLEEVNARLLMEASYEIKHETKDCISIAFSGLEYLEGSAYPVGMFYTVNIDLVAVKKIRLADRVVIDDNLMSALYRAAEKQLTSSQYEYYIREDNYGDKGKLMLYLNSADADGEGFENYRVFSYFTPNVVGIVLPIIHALGDYLIIEVPIDEVSLR
ncbi:MAG: hypothetical protein FWH42_05975 [Dehalococcoidia bacterium]|nr:hypothetical protein [Dehalococcoidia bacterium]